MPRKKNGPTPKAPQNRKQGPVLRVDFSQMDEAGMIEDRLKSTGWVSALEKERYMRYVGSQVPLPRLVQVVAPVALHDAVVIPDVHGLDAVVVEETR